MAFLQLAIDRVSMDEARRIITLAVEYVDLVEIGTSLIKDFGLAGSVGVIRKEFPTLKLLADMKIIDEGEYEARAAFAAGADIITVMGAAANATINACSKTAKELGREYMIDLLEVPSERMRALSVYNDAIFCLHLPSDKDGEGLNALIEEGCVLLPGVKHFAAAGGVRIETLPILSRCGIEIAIIGSAISKSGDIAKTAAQFKAAFV